jgi:hypothetical protein
METSISLNAIVQANSLHCTSLATNIMQKVNCLKQLPHVPKSLSVIYDFMKKIQIIIENLQTNITLLNKMSDEIIRFTNLIEKDLSGQKREEDYIHHTYNGMLDYPERISDDDRSSLKKILELSFGKSTLSPIHSQPIQTYKSYHIKELNYKMTLPTVNKLSEIPPAFYLYKDEHKPENTGIYINLGSSNIVKVCFPTIIDSTKDFNKSHTIKCKYVTEQNCKANTQGKTCFYAHKGDDIIKIGIQARCPECPNFGNPQTIRQDIKNVTNIETLLMYGVNDLLISKLWLDYKKIKGRVYELDNT